MNKKIQELDQPFNAQTPIQLISDKHLDDLAIKLFVKREELLHQQISGNKWHKLKFNLEEARAQSHTTLLSFGGAYSNHIHALAYAGKHFGFKTIGMIRGDELEKQASQGILNPCLDDCKQQGMELHFLSRSEYRDKTAPHFVENLKRRFGDFYIIPEGGANKNGVAGCKYFMDKLIAQLKAENIHPKKIFIACGTGTTFAGFLESLISSKEDFVEDIHLEGILCVNDKNNIEKYVKDQLETKQIGLYKDQAKRWSFNDNYTFGGFAKSNKQLLGFIRQFEINQNIQLDPVYTGKLVYAIYQEAQKGFIDKGSQIIMVHSGGLQGVRALGG